jgi:hypothetical protein
VQRDNMTEPSVHRQPVLIGVVSLANCPGRKTAVLGR